MYNCIVGKSYDVIDRQRNMVKEIFIKKVYVACSQTKIAKLYELDISMSCLKQALQLFS